MARKIMTGTASPNTYTNGETIVIACGIVEKFK
jgi:hypothetical protein